MCLLIFYLIYNSFVQNILLTLFKTLSSIVQFWFYLDFTFDFTFIQFSIYFMKGIHFGFKIKKTKKSSCHLCDIFFFTHFNSICCKFIETEMLLFIYIIFLLIINFCQLYLLMILKPPQFSNFIPP